MHEPLNAPANGPIASALLQAVPNPLFAIARNDTVAFANAAAENFFQCSFKKLSRLELDKLIPPTSPLYRLIDQVRADPVTINEYEVTIGTPRTGGPRTVDLQLAPVPEQPEAVLVQVWPRTVAQEIDRQLTHRGAARSVTGMAGMLAHEIKNPLSGIRGAAQLLEAELGEPSRHLARLICEETDRICGLVDQMEVFSDERPLQRRPVNIHDVLDHVKTVAQSGFARGIEFQEQYDPSLPPVHGNRDQLIQVVLNLLKNAAEAMDGTDRFRRIALSTAFRPGVWLTLPGTRERVSLPLELCVNDSGPGIPEDLRPHLFDPFVSTKPQGMGLGLALVAKIVRDHGGIIDCRSQSAGTTFRILLPLFTGTGERKPGDMQ